MITQHPPTRQVKAQPPRAMTVYRTRGRSQTSEEHLPTYSTAPALPRPALRRHQVHWTLYVGLSMLIMLLGWVSLTFLSQWWQVTRVTVTPSRGTDDQHGTRVLHVMGAGTWAYQFSDTALHHMAQLIAGKRRQEATTLLFEQPGVSQVAMTISGVAQASLPADAGRIRFLLLSRPL